MNVLKSLNQRGQHNWIKILCLAVGLATGIVLIGKAGFEQSWDKYFDTSNRIYVVYEEVIRDGEYQHFAQVSGAVAHGMKRYCPQIEAATRYTGFGWDLPLVTEDDKRIRTNFFFADSCFFDVFPFRILAGNPKKVLSQSNYCMIPQSMAEKMGGDVVGKKVYYNKRGNLALTIGGIYEDIPLNSRLHDLEVLVSMPTLPQMTWDGRENWVGNDRYLGYVRLAKGITPDDLKLQIQKMKHDNLPVDELKKAGTDFDYSLRPLADDHTHDDATRRMIWIVSLLAVVLIGCAVMNYLLLVVGGISLRAREMAVHRCYGAEAHNIYGRVMVESVVHLLLSLVLAGILLFIFQDTINELTGMPLLVILTTGNNIWFIALTCLVVFIITGVIPGWAYTHIPMTAAFKHYNHSHRSWKMMLLGLQFASATFLFVLLLVVGRQYQLMVNDNPGYDYSTLADLDTRELSLPQTRLVVSELKKMSGVKGVTTSYAYLPERQSGDNILLPGDVKEYMNVADLFDVGDGYFNVMGIPVIAGRTFTEQTDTMREAMVSRKFEEKMKQLAGWDQAVGKQVICTSYRGPYTIVGVFDDPRIGSITNPDTRPSICFYDRSMKHAHHITVRFNDMDALDAANKRLHELIPDNPDIAIRPYTMLMTQLYTDAQRFRSTVMIGGLVALIIALIGLVGYLAGEMARRQKEIAVRKVNGAQIVDVLRLFIRDILRLALPAVVVGAVGGWYVSRLWLEQFCEKAVLSPILFVLCALAVVAVILSVVCIGCYRVAVGNPVDYLKNE